MNDEYLRELIAELVMVIGLVMMKVGQNLIIWLSLRFEQFILLFLPVDILNQVFCQQRDWI